MEKNPAKIAKIGTNITQVLNITGVPSKSVGGNFFLRINKTGGDLLNKFPKQNEISSYFIRNCRVVKFTYLKCLQSNYWKSEE